MNIKDLLDLILTAIIIGVVGGFFVGALVWGLSHFTNSFCV
jgi:hypothetical protein